MDHKNLMSSERPNPFLGLTPYKPEDRQKLYGRDRDLILISDRIFSARTTLLFAGSGVGKTSFLNAKVRPEFEGKYCVLYHNDWTASEEPLAALKRTILKGLDEGLRPSSVNMEESLASLMGAFKQPESESSNQ